MTKPSSAFMYHLVHERTGAARAIKKIREFVAYLPAKLDAYEDLRSGQVIWRERTRGVGVLDMTGCLSLGVTGPVLRSAGLPWDLRRTMPYCGYEDYEFEVPTATTADVWGRYQVRLAEIRESLKIVEQAVDRLEPGPVMVEDCKIAWPAQLASGADGMGNSLGALLADVIAGGLAGPGDGRLRPLSLRYS